MKQSFIWTFFVLCCSLPLGPAAGLAGPASPAPQESQVSPEQQAAEDTVQAFFSAWESRKIEEIEPMLHKDFVSLLDENKAKYLKRMRNEASFADSRRIQGMFYGASMYGGRAVIRVNYLYLDQFDHLPKPNTWCRDAKYELVPGQNGKWFLIRERLLSTRCPKLDN